MAPPWVTVAGKIRLVEHPRTGPVRLPVEDRMAGTVAVCAVHLLIPDPAVSAVPVGIRCKAAVRSPG
jgi:hypothetical protein